MSHVHRLRLSDRIFFVTVNQRQRLPVFREAEYRLVASAIEESRRKLKFLFAGYVLMPDHWHVLVWPAYPLTISRVSAGHQMDFVAHGKRCATNEWGLVAASILGPLCPARLAVPGVGSHDTVCVSWVVHGGRIMHLNPVRKGLVRQPREWRWSSYNNFLIDKERVSRCPLRIDYVDLPPPYRG